jgi:hypothetical protein
MSLAPDREPSKGPDPSRDGNAVSKLAGALAVVLVDHKRGGG